MDRMLEELYIQGKTVDDIAECLKTVPLHPHVIAAIRSAHALGCHLMVASDSNQFYINTILEHHGIYNCFNEIITNPVAVAGGRLRIFPFHGPSSPHGCELCPTNLCKGRVIEQIQPSKSDGRRKRLIYIGDGNNDFCPTLKLVEGDSVMPRKNFPLWGRILNNPQLVKAKLYEWNSGEDLARTLLKIINKISDKDNTTQTATQNGKCDPLHHVYYAE